MLPSRSKKQNSVLPRTFNHYDSLTKLKPKRSLGFFSLTQPVSDEIPENLSALRTLRYRENEADNQPLFSERANSKSSDRRQAPFHERVKLNLPKFMNFTSTSWKTDQNREAETNPPNTDRPRTQGFVSPPQFNYRGLTASKFTKPAEALARSAAFDNSQQQFFDDTKTKGTTSYSDFLQGEKGLIKHKTNENDDQTVPINKKKNEGKKPDGNRIFHTKASLMTGRDERFLAHLNSLPLSPRDLFREHTAKISSNLEHSRQRSKFQSFGENLKHSKASLMSPDARDQYDEDLERSAWEKNHDDSLEHEPDYSKGEQEGIDKKANLVKNFRRFNNINLGLKKRFLTKKFSVIGKNTNEYLENVNELAEDFCKNFNEYMERGSSKRLFRILYKELEGFDSHFKEALINLSEYRVIMPMFPEYVILKMQIEKWDPDPEEYTKTDSKQKYLQGYLNFIGPIDQKKVEKTARINKILTEQIIKLRKRNIDLIGSSIIDLERTLAQKHLSKLDSYIHRGMGRHYSNHIKILMKSNVKSEPFVSNMAQEIKKYEVKYGTFQKIDPRTKSLFKALDTVSRKILMES